MAKIVAYIVYLIAMAVSGFVMGETYRTIKNWRYWVLLVCILTVYICGYIRGGA